MNIIAKRAEEGNQLQMVEVRYDPLTYPAEFRVIFEFPPRSELDTEIEMEVKNIMTGAMKEHLSRLS